MLHIPTFIVWIIYQNCRLAKYLANAFLGQNISLLRSFYIWIYNKNCSNGIRSNEICINEIRIRGGSPVCIWLSAEIQTLIQALSCTALCRRVQGCARARASALLFALRRAFHQHRVATSFGTVFSHTHPRKMSVVKQLLLHLTQ